MKFLLSTALILVSSGFLPTSTHAFAPTLGGSQALAQLSAQKIGSANFGGEWDPNSVGNSAIQSIEFKIYPDGRVEEKVIGVKGNNCHAVTEKINEALGKVIQSAPTEELFEQEVVVEAVQTVKNGISSGDSWEGQSSW